MIYLNWTVPVTDPCDPTNNLRLSRIIYTYIHTYIHLLLPHLPPRRGPAQRSGAPPCSRQWVLHSRPLAEVFTPQPVTSRKRFHGGFPQVSQRAPTLEYFYTYSHLLIYHSFIFNAHPHLPYSLYSYNCAFCHTFTRVIHLHFQPSAFLLSSQDCSLEALLYGGKGMVFSRMARQRRNESTACSSASNRLIPLRLRESSGQSSTCARAHARVKHAISSPYFLRHLLFFFDYCYNFLFGCSCLALHLPFLLRQRLLSFIFASALFVFCCFSFVSYFSSPWVIHQ